jgi:hypothetical protein
LASGWSPQQPIKLGAENAELRKENAALKAKSSEAFKENS